MKNKKLLTIAFALVAIIALVSILVLSGNNVKKGIYRYSDTAYIEISEKNIKKHLNGELKYDGEYSLENGIISFDNDEGKTQYRYDKKQHVIYNYDPVNGIVPDGDRFNATCRFDEGTIIYTFRDDGTYIKTITYLTAGDGGSFDGYYKRNGNVITITFDSGSVIYHYVEDGKLYSEAYVLENN